MHALFDEPLPQEGLPIDAVLGELRSRLLPYCTHVNHPGYFGLITPTPAPAGILGDFIASALNQNLGDYTIGPSAVAMERQTVRWLNDLVGYDERARIRDIVLYHPKVKGMHDLRTRRAGLQPFIQLHLALDGDMRLLEAHEIADEVEARIKQAFPAAEVLIHQDPEGVEEPSRRFL